MLRHSYCPHPNTVLYLNNYKRKEVITMPRTRGSKNKPKVTKDYAYQIAEKQETIASLNTEIASITANIDTLKAEACIKHSADRKEKLTRGKSESLITPPSAVLLLLEGLLFTRNFMWCLMSIHRII